MCAIHSRYSAKVATWKDLLSGSKHHDVRPANCQAPSFPTMSLAAKKKNMLSTCAGANLTDKGGSLV